MLRARNYESRLHFKKVKFICESLMSTQINGLIFKQLSQVKRKPGFCILCKIKATDQLGSNCTADQCLCLCYIDSRILLLPKSKISSLWSSSVFVLEFVLPGFVSDLVGNPEDRFSHDTAHIQAIILQVILAKGQTDKEIKKRKLATEEKAEEGKRGKTEKRETPADLALQEKVQSKIFIIQTCM